MVRCRKRKCTRCWVNLRKCLKSLMVIWNGCENKKRGKCWWWSSKTKWEKKVGSVMSLKFIFCIFSNFHNLELSYSGLMSFVTCWKLQFSYQAVHLVLEKIPYFKVFMGSIWLLGENFSQMTSYANSNSFSNSETFILHYVDPLFKSQCS